MHFYEVLSSFLQVGRAWLVGFVVFVVVGGLFLGAGSPKPQPIAFNHAKHVQSGIGCPECHAGAVEQQRATLPRLEVCLTCHESALTQSAEEAKIRTAAASGQELQWIQVTRMAPHIFFPHRRHVVAGKQECATCHGPMEKATSPPARRFRRLNMDDCIGCHEHNNVKSDCNDCHR